MICRFQKLPIVRWSGSMNWIKCAQEWIQIQSIDRCENLLIWNLNKTKIYCWFIKRDEFDVDIFYFWLGTKGDNENKDQRRCDAFQLENRTWTRSSSFNKITKWTQTKPLNNSTMNAVTTYNYNYRRNR